MISGVLVVSKPEHQSRVRTALELLPWVEVHHEDPDGRLVITIEADDIDQATARLCEVKEMPRVLMAEIVEHHVEDPREPRLPEDWEPTAKSRQKGAIFFQCEELAGAADYLDADPRKWSRGKRVLWRPEADGEELSLDFDVPKDGKYGIYVVMTMTPKAGKCDVELNGKPLKGLHNGHGKLDLYTPFHTISRWFRSALVELKAGKNTITFVSRGKNEASQGTEIGADFLWIQP